MKPILTAVATIAAYATLAAPLWAQPSETRIQLELNGASTTAQGACQLTLVVTNQLPTGLSRAAWQVAIFDTQGAVQSLPVLDFGALLPGKTRVAQFALPDTACDQLGRIVVNDVAECTASDGSDQRAACLGGLATRNRSQIEFGL